jgi:hypothetical protein
MKNEKDHLQKGFVAKLRVTGSSLSLSPSRVSSLEPHPCSGTGARCYDYYLVQGNIRCKKIVRVQ